MGAAWAARKPWSLAVYSGKNKAKDHFKRDALFNNKIVQNVQHSSSELHEVEVDLSDQNIKDSQLQMMFAICNPRYSARSSDRAVLAYTLRFWD
jgi:predicted RNA polymerase sigma factor